MCLHFLCCTLFSHIITEKQKQPRHMKTTFINSLSYKNLSMPLFKWPKKPFIAVNLPELPAGDQRWQENESSDSMSTLICFLVVHPIMKNILINWRKVIHFAFLVDETTLTGSSTSQLRKGNNVFTFWQDASHSQLLYCLSGEPGSQNSGNQHPH